MKQRALKYALFAALGLRLGTSLFLALLSALLPVDNCASFPCSQMAYAEMQDDLFSRLFLAPWYRWDSVHYLDIADPAYQIYGIENTVWPPLFPLLIRLFSWVMAPMLATLLISTAALAAAFYLLYVEVSTRWDEEAAGRVLLLAAVFPTAFFLAAAYSEALFLAFSLGVFAALRRRNWLLAGMLGAFATLTRLQGVFLALPLAWEGLCWLRERPFVQDRQSARRTLARLLCGAALIPLSLAVYFIYTHYVLGAPWPWLTLTTHWEHHLGWPGEGLVRNLLFLLTQPFQLIHISIFYDLFLLAFLFALLLKKTPGMPFTYALYGLVMLLVPSLRLSNNWSTMTSMARYAVVVFPAFISLALLLRGRISRLIWLAFSLCSQALLLILFYRWIWVA